MSKPQLVAKTWGFGKLTQAFGTAIVRTIQPVINHYTHLSSLKYLAAGTAHTITVMRPLGRTTLSAAADANQAVINLTADPGSIAGNDYVVIAKPDGTFHTGVVSSVNSLAVTLTANVPTGGFANGAIVWFMGVAGDHTNSQFDGTASTLVSHGDGISSLFGTLDDYAPMIVYSNNATAAGTLQQVSGFYSPNVPAVF